MTEYKKFESQSQQNRCIKNSYSNVTVLYQIFIMARFNFDINLFRNLLWNQNLENGIKKI